MIWSLGYWMGFQRGTQKALPAFEEVGLELPIHRSNLDELPLGRGKLSALWCCNHLARAYGLGEE